MIQNAKSKDLKAIKTLIDSTDEMDVVAETFPVAYYRRLLKEGILLIDKECDELVGVCFGKYNVKEKWADLLGLSVKKEFQHQGRGRGLITAFENIVKNKKIKTIDLYADESQIELFKKAKYVQGRTYTAFRKKF